MCVCVCVWGGGARAVAAVKSTVYIIYTSVLCDVMMLVKKCEVGFVAKECVGGPYFLSFLFNCLSFFFLSFPGQF